jgi:hypothetical protein
VLIIEKSLLRKGIFKFADFVKAIWVVISTTLLLSALEAVRVLVPPKTTMTANPGSWFSYIISGIGFAFLAIFVYHQVQNRWPQNAGQVYLWIALGLIVLFSVVAIIMPFVMKSASWKDVIVWIAMHLVMGLGYGIFLPRMLG